MPAYFNYNIQHASYQSVLCVPSLDYDTTVFSVTHTQHCVYFTTVIIKCIQHASCQSVLRVPSLDHNTTDYTVYTRQCVYFITVILTVFLTWPGKPGPTGLMSIRLCSILEFLHHKTWKQDNYSNSSKFEKKIQSEEIVQRV